jgi:pyrophosphatase PpaX
VKRSPYTCALFDLDGTLIDSTGLILAAYRHTMRQHLGRELPDELWLSGLGKPLDVQLGELARDEPEKLAMRGTYRSFYLEHHDRMLAPFPGVPAALAVLRDAGLALGLVTSKMRDTTLKALELCGLEDLLPVVVTVNDVRRGKPDPEPVLLALQLLDMKPADAIFTGDSPFDMAAGRAAGTAVAAVGWGPFPRESLAAYTPDRWLEKIEDLATLAD